MFLHLYKRQSTYYYRIKIPIDIRSHFNGKELIVKSLRTKDINAAKVYASHINREVQQSFALLRVKHLNIDQYLSNPIEFPEPKSQSKSQKPSKDSFKLSVLIEKFISEKSANWTARTTDDFRGKFRIILKLLPDRSIHTITRDDCVSCRETLAKLPPNFTKKKCYKRKSIKQLAAIENTPKLSTKTVNMYLVLISSLFKWAVKYGFMGANLAEGLQLDIKSFKSEERKTYTIDDIQKIFNALPYSKEAPENFFIPRIARWSGMRLEEICQMKKSDVKAIDGILCFDVNDDENKQLKTSSSKRIIPIHQELINDGLIEYIKSLKGGNLWPNLKADKYGRYGKAYGNRYGRLNRKLIDDPRKCFHSFRHTVADTLKQAGVNDTVIIELLGHDDPKITTGRYGKRYRPLVLQEALNKL
jgi:integrase